mmetsp:Transcript_104789/g.301269  ORF Transcript_104789/g.301269 Transcript_104789/m.301269 type:complete len:95 (+) Transcript_104789:435-719(+)
MLPDLQRSAESHGALADATNNADADEAMLTPLSSALAAEAEEADSTGYIGMLRGAQCPLGQALADESSVPFGRLSFRKSGPIHHGPRTEQRRER